ncbi:methylated-DNA--[protein]-cysteine S-methyltransferase [Hamadaea tsunoensis]|uniref:methylated-DNA--[protein]-cysteine S-methyltransferase n=1 Tax=Hamadaea tsunoensis TaxID=53368 RepID=UPI000410992E|nr:methylated-DNA--[protein]-cysteine S-methyltransferase [Hamadaea tsunoensis]
MTVYTIFETPLGEIQIVGERTPRGTALRSLSFPGQRKPVVLEAAWQRDDAAFAEITAQLSGYLAGEVREFRFEYADSGTPFQQSVWKALDTLAYGETVTYGELAERAGYPRTSVRAVASAIGRNPLMILRPCHRVLGADGGLTGFAGGVERKEQLLALEAAV